MSLSFLSTVLDPEEVRRRRYEARRNGVPAWLWPEVPVERWSEAMANITAAVSAVLAGQTAELAECEPMALSVACYTSGVGPLLGWWLEAGLVSAAAEARDLLALHLEHSRVRSSRVERQSREIVTALDACGVPVVVLKGGHTSHHYFPEPATRPASDLDLLVPKDLAAQAEVALARAGLECARRSRRESSWVPRDGQPEPRSLWFMHSDDPWSIDLHSSLDFCASAGAQVVRFDTAEPIETSQPWPLDHEAGVLSEPLLMLHLAVHASGGLHSLTLLRMIELVLVARKDAAAGMLSWDELLHVGAQIQALGSAYPALSMAEKLAPGTVPPHALEICAELAQPRARAVVDKLDPASAHRVERASIDEHFMWVSGLSGWARQLASDIAPHSDFWPIYQARAYRLLRGRISR